MKSLIGNTRRHDLVFCTDGQIGISARVARMLNLYAGDVVDIVYHDGEYYLYVRCHNAFGQHKGRVYLVSKYGHYMRFNSKKISNVMFTACGAKANTFVVKLCVGEKTTLPNHGDALPIITKMIIS